MAASATSLKTIRGGPHEGRAHIGLVFRNNQANLLNANRVKTHNTIRALYTKGGEWTAANKRDLRTALESLKLTKRQCHKLARIIIDEKLPRATPLNAATRGTLLFWAWLWMRTYEREQTKTPEQKLANFIARSEAPLVRTGRSPVSVKFTTTPRKRAMVRPKRPTYLTANNVRIRLESHMAFRSGVNRNHPTNREMEQVQKVLESLGTTTARLHRLAAGVLDRRIKSARSWVPAQPGVATEPSSRNKTHYHEALFWAWVWNITKGGNYNHPRNIIINAFQKRGVPPNDARAWEARLANKPRRPAPAPAPAPSAVAQAPRRLQRPPTPNSWNTNN